MASAKRSAISTRPGQPPDFRAAELADAGQRFMVMSYALPDWEFPASLTPAERAVLTQVLAGATQRDIAAARKVSVRTVANQMAAVFAKLDVGSRVELASRLTASRRTRA